MLQETIKFDLIKINNQWTPLFSLNNEWYEKAVSKYDWITSKKIKNIKFRFLIRKNPKNLFKLFFKQNPVIKDLGKYKMSWIKISSICKKH